MRISRAELKKIISEELEVVLTNEEAGEMFGEDVRDQLATIGNDGKGEGSMAVKQLNNIGMMSGDVLDLVDDSDNLDEWVEAKITKAHDYLNTVFNHLRGESVEHVSLTESAESDAAFEEFELALQRLRDVASSLPPDELSLLSVQAGRMANSLDNQTKRTRPPEPPADDEEGELVLPQITADKIRALKQGLRKQKSPRAAGDFRSAHDRFMGEQNENKKK